jgi:hypothetical protein
MRMAMPAGGETNERRRASGDTDSREMFIRGSCATSARACVGARVRAAQ